MYKFLIGSFISTFSFYFQHNRFVIPPIDLDEGNRILYNTLPSIRSDCKSTLAWRSALWASIIKLGYVTLRARVDSAKAFDRGKIICNDFQHLNNEVFRLFAFYRDTFLSIDQRARQISFFYNIDDKFSRLWFRILLRNLSNVNFFCII